MSERTINSDEAGQRFDRWIRRAYPGVTQGMLEKQLRKGLIKLDGKRAKSSDRLDMGQVVRIAEGALTLSGDPIYDSPKKKQIVVADDATQAKLRAMVVYDDRDVMVINKPAGLAVQGGSGQKTHLDGMLQAYGLREGNTRPLLVHRLDKDTSGVLVLAKTPRAATELGKMLAGKEVRKLYLALVVGVPKPREGVIDQPLAKGNDYGFEKMGVDEDAGKRAVTEYRVLDTAGQKLALVELSPVTGRMHQLRVHMAHIGCPIVGDGKYGGPQAFLEGMKIAPKLHLHAHRIIIPDLFGRTIQADAPLPKHMLESMASLGLEI